jgi:hypothetical protein
MRENINETRIDTEKRGCGTHSNETRIVVGDADDARERSETL